MENAVARKQQEKLVAVHPELKRHYKPSGRLTHFDGREDDLAGRVQTALQSGAPHCRGRFPGSLIVEIAPQGVYCKVAPEGRTREGYEKLEARRAEAVLHTKELVAEQTARRSGDKRRRRIRLLGDNVRYFLVAVHGFSSDRQPGRDA